MDFLGAGLAVIFLAGLTYGLIEAPSHGWTSPAVFVSLLVAALTAPAFLVVEHVSAHPMLPLGVFRSRQFSGANAVTFAVYGALGGALFLLPVELQLVVGYSPLESGLALLPVTFIMLLFSARSGQLAARIGPRLQMTGGPFVVGAGLLLLTRATQSGSYLVQVFPAVIVFGIGLAITVAPLTSTAMGAAPAEHAGVASAVNNVVARAAGLLAVAVLPLLAGITGAAALDPHEIRRRLPQRHGHRRTDLRGRGCHRSSDHPQSEERAQAVQPPSQEVPLRPGCHPARRRWRSRDRRHDSVKEG